MLVLLSVWANVNAALLCRQGDSTRLYRAFTPPSPLCGPRRPARPLGTQHGLLIRSSMCGHPDPFRSVRDLGRVPARCSSSSGFPEGCSPRWLPAWLPRRRVHGSGGRQPHLANLCRLPACTQLPQSPAAKIIPHMFRIMDESAVTVGRQTVCSWLVEDPGAACQPETRKVGGSILPLTTSHEPCRPGVEQGKCN